MNYKWDPFLTTFSEQQQQQKIHNLLLVVLFFSFGTNPATMIAHYPGTRTGAYPALLQI